MTCMRQHRCNHFGTNSTRDISTPCSPILSQRLRAVFTTFFCSPGPRTSEGPFTLRVLLGRGHRFCDGCCDKIELTRLLFYSDIQPVFIGAIRPFATLAYQASRAFQGLLGPSCHYSLPPCHLATSLGTDFQQAVHILLVT